MIDIENIAKTKAFEDIKSVNTQVDYYIENGSHPDIIKLVSLGNKSFGERTQRIIKECLNLDNPTNSGHDVQQTSTGNKMEVKSSRFWVNTGDWRWQHIMENHEYDYLLLCGVNFDNIDVFIISKTDFLNLKESGLVTQQGNAEGQGLWCNYRDIKDYLTQIKNIEDLNNFINKS